MGILNSLIGRLCVGFGLVSALLVARPAAASTINTFNELALVGGCPGQDAGAIFPTACQITGGPYGIISGDIGTGPDVTDMFAFHWITTGTFQATYSAGSFAGEVFLGLYNFLSPWAPVAGQQQINDTLTVPNLAAGDYILVLDTDDPPFTIDIFELNPNGSVNAGIPNPICGIGSNCAVPEPSTMVLLGTGLFAAGLRFARRRLGSRGSSK